MTPDIQQLPITETGLSGKLVNDYLQDDPFLNPFHAGRPDTEHLLKAAAHRNNYPVDRKTLAAVLRSQYAESGIDDQNVFAQINRLEQDNTFTVTTGQQTAILLGPAYTLMKILSAIKLSESLNQKDSQHTYIPIFWMATEDHDVEEIRHHWFRGQNYSWATNQQGPVGRFNTDGITAIIDAIEKSAGKSPSMLHLLDQLRKAYSGNSLSVATRKIVHALFGSKGLLIIDPDDQRLKSLFTAIIARDIRDGNSFSLVSESARKLSARYPVQVNSRQVNFFWIENGLRTRIELSGQGFKTVNGEKIWSRETLLQVVQERPEYFSPNVIMRPLYQESILPNIAYVGGGAEIAYWMELQSLFTHYERPFPILLLRSSLTFLNSVHSRQIKKLRLELPDIFQPSAQLIKKVILEKFGDTFIDKTDFALLNPLFEQLENKAKMVASSKVASLAALQKRWRGELEKYNRKLIQYRTKREAELVLSLNGLHDAVYPAGILQERIIGLPELVFLTGIEMIDELLKSIDPVRPSMLLYSC
jgi:bacillithiol biosynthesis cysteine-adding enzyme BshC